jgi:hypothetical protein
MLKGGWKGLFRSAPGPADRLRLSVVLIVHRMSVQAERTLMSLSPAYQEGVSPEDYEIILVENASDDPLGETRARAAAGGAVLRYFWREETQRSPVPAVNFGAAQGRGPHLAIAIDGARMLTPGVLRLTLAALRADRRAVVSVPGYHLGSELQQVAVNKGHDAAADQALLQGIGWPEAGYRLFDIAVLSGSCRGGFFRPHAESNFLAMSRAIWNAVGGMDTRYDDHGGGMVNVALYRRLLDMPETALYLLYGEGTFHQVHGGVTTNTPESARAGIMKAIVAQDAALRPDRSLPGARPILFGPAAPQVLRFLRYSLDRAEAGGQAVANDGRT